MLSAYVLIESEVGKVAHVAQAMRDLDGAQVAEDLAGPYDVIARVRRPVWMSSAGWSYSGSRCWTASPAP